MRAHHGRFRLTALAAIAAMAIGAVAPAYAQAPTQPPPGEAPLAGGDPPSRVGRVARLSGTVSFHTADADHWEPATLNYPVTSGNAFWTQPSAAADLDLGRTRITLDQTTEFSVDGLDDLSLLATAGQGRVFLRIGDLGPGETATLRTPRGSVTFRQPGRYEVAVGDTQTPTRVTVEDGAAQISGPGLDLSVSAHQTAELSGADPFTGVVVAEVGDAFLSAQLARDAPQGAPSAPGPGPAAPPPAVLQMTGYEEVATTGTWEEAPDYGRVWYPPVARDWVPYRQGRWSWVAPWGWTWVDDASWGFAPFHYGRWVEIHDRWAWTPVEPGIVAERPCYAPALVTFVGAAAGVAVGVGIAAAVGWIPLGPREVYRPPYRASDAYLRRVNVTSIRNVTNISNTTINTTVVNNRFINNRAVTVVPASAMQRSLPVAGQARPFGQAQQAAFQPLARPPVQPTLATRGVTPAVARAMNLPQGPAGGVLQQPVAPGPAFRQRPVEAGPGVANRPGRPVPGASFVPAQPGPAQPGPAQPGPAPGGVPPVAGRPGAAAGAPGPAIAPRFNPGAARPPAEAAPGGRPGVPPGVSPGVPPGAVGAPVQGRPAGAPPTPSGPSPQAPRPGPANVPPAAPSRPPQPGPAQPQGPGPRPPTAQPEAPRPSPRPVPQAVQPPAPRPQMAPQPAPQIAPQAAPRPAPPPRPAPAPAPRPQAPPPRPAAPPAPVARPAPPPSRPAPPPARPVPEAHRACPPGRPAC